MGDEKVVVSVGAHPGLQQFLALKVAVSLEFVRLLGGRVSDELGHLQLNLVFLVLDVQVDCGVEEALEEAEPREVEWESIVEDVPVRKDLLEPDHDPAQDLNEGVGDADEHDDVLLLAF